MAETALLAEASIDITTIVTCAIGAFVTLYLAKLSRQITGVKHEVCDVKETVVEVKDTGDANHQLLNSGRLEMQRIIALNTLFKANITKDPVDIATAAKAELDYQTHKTEAEKMAAEAEAKAETKRADGGKDIGL